MKTILIMFLYIASAQCGVLKDDLKKVGSSSNAEHRIQQVELIKVIDSYETGGITFLNDILIDVTKDKESQGTNIETDTSGLAPGLHTWETKFLSSEQSQQEINRILGIVETTANKTGQLLSKTCTTGDTAVTCHFNINIDVTNANKSKIRKREIQILNNEPTDKDEINRILNLVEAAGNTNGDGKNCKTVDGALICNVYLPAESTSQSPSKIYKREIGHQAKTQLKDAGEVIVIPDATNAIANTTTDSNTNCTTVECLFDNSSFLVADECPPGKLRADDGTCVEVIM